MLHVSQRGNVAVSECALWFWATVTGAGVRASHHGFLRPLRPLPLGASHLLRVVESQAEALLRENQEGDNPQACRMQIGVSNQEVAHAWERRVRCGHTFSGLP